MHFILIQKGNRSESCTPDYLWRQMLPADTALARSGKIPFYFCLLSLFRPLKKVKGSLNHTTSLTGWETGKVWIDLFSCFLYLLCWHTAKGLNDLRHLTPTFLDSPPFHFYLLVLFLLNWVSCVLFSNERIIFLPLRQKMLRYFLDMLTEQQTTASVPLAVWMWQTGYCPVSIWKTKNLSSLIGLYTGSFQVAYAEKMWQMWVSHITHLHIITHLCLWKSQRTSWQWPCKMLIYLC